MKTNFDKGKTLSNKNIIQLSPKPNHFGESPDELAPKMFSSKTPTQNTHSYYEDPVLGLYVGLWDTTDMVEKGGPYSCDEFMWLLEGEVEIKNTLTGKKQTVKAGEAFLIPKGYDCQWCQTGYLRKFYFISEHPEENIPISPAVDGIVNLSSSASATNFLAENSPQEKTDYWGQKRELCYQNHNGKFYSGKLNCDSNESKFQRTSVNEMVVVLEGELYLTDETGKQLHFKKNDVFFVPQGVICKWKTEGPLKTFYVVLENDIPTT